MNRRRFLYLTSALVLPILMLIALLASGNVLAQDPNPPSPPAEPAMNIAADLGTSFTYQGQLQRGGDPVDGACHMAFRLYESAGDETQVGLAITHPVTITGGLFTKRLDFGNVFTGTARWLGIRVMCPGEGDTDFADLGRQALTAAPYALYALSAPWSGLTGMPPGFADGVDDVTAVVSGTNIFATDGLTQISEGDSVTMSVNFGGSGTATTVARSDHDHDDRYYTQGQLNTSGGGGQVHWDNLISVPTDLGLTYTAGTGLALSDHTFSVTPTYRLPQGCAGGQIAEWNETAGLWECGTDDQGGDASAWLLTGNAGTDPATHFLGTTDNVSLTLAVNGTTALRLDPTSGTPNVIGGYEGNGVYPALYGVTIGGGGMSGQANYVDDGNYSTIGGGLDHGILGDYATIGGGRSNYAMGHGATIGGGRDNMTRNSYATVGGGYDNIGDADYATIAGGHTNDADGQYAAIPGGYGNDADGDYSFAAGRQAQARHDGAFVWADAIGSPITSTTENQFLVRATGGVTLNTTSGALRLTGPITSPNLIGGYVSNTVSAGVYGATIGGGGDNSEPNYVTDDYGTVGGGRSNEAGNYATVGGGEANWATNDYATISGGDGNAATGEHSTIGGGSGNTAGGGYATVPGGHFNDAVGDYSFAAGLRARALHDGAFVWADSVDTLLNSTANDQFLVRATGGVSFTTDGAPFHINGKPVYQPDNMVVVAQSGGDTTSVQAAIDSIADAAADNPYLVWVAPGVYSETVTMKPYVHLQGAGQEATVISSAANTSDWPPTIGTLVLAEHVSLRDLTVTNSGTGDRNVALLATNGSTQTLIADVTAQAQGAGSDNYGLFLTGSDTGVTLQHVTGLGENGNSNYGLYNGSGADVTLHGGSFTGREGAQCWGINNTNSTLEAEGVMALGKGDSSSTGVANRSNGDAVLRGGSFTGRGGDNAKGIYTDSSATLEAKEVTALGWDAANTNIGLRAISSGNTVLRGGSFTGGGGVEASGIHNNNTPLETDDVTALGENGTSSSKGFYNNSATTAMRGGSFTGRGGEISCGIANVSGATLETQSITVLATEATIDTYGLYNVGGSEAAVHGGTFTADGGTSARGIQNEDSGTRLETESVTAAGENASSSNYGLYNDNADAMLRDSSFTGRGDSSAWGIYNYNSDATLEAEDVTALGENGTTSNYGYGLYNDYGTATLRGGSFTGHGGNYARGILNYGSGVMDATLEAENATALAENGAIQNYGLENSGFATATLRGGSFIGRGNVTRGIYSHGSGATLNAQRITALGENGNTNHGLRITDGIATVTQGVLGGETNSVVRVSGAITVSNSRLVGGGVSGSVTCVAVSRGATWSQNSCP